MLRSEFERLHGEKTWESLVPPLQAPNLPLWARTNANFLTHANIIDTLRSKEIPANGLLEAEHVFTPTDWKVFLSETGLSGTREYFNRRRDEIWDAEKKSEARLLALQSPVLLSENQNPS